MVRKFKLPLRMFSPPNDVVCAIWSMAWSDESTWSWLAAISLALSAPVLAELATRLLIPSSSEPIWPKALSAVAINSSAVWLLLMAALAPVILVCRIWLAIKPAGLSAPVLICKPVLNWVSEVCNCCWELANAVCASSELMFVLIRDMPDTHSMV